MDRKESREDLAFEAISASSATLADLREQEANGTIEASDLLSAEEAHESLLEFIMTTPGLFGH